MKKIVTFMMVLVLGASLLAEITKKQEIAVKAENQIDTPTIEKTVNLGYQGKVENQNGSVLEDGKYNVTFRIYSAEDAKETIWSETKEMEIQNGIISTELGSVKEMNPSMFDKQLYITIDVDGNESAKQLLTGSPYSMIAERISEEALVAGEGVNIEKTEDGKLMISAMVTRSGKVGDVGDGGTRGVYTISELRLETVNGSKTSLKLGSKPANDLTWQYPGTIEHHSDSNYLLIKSSTPNSIMIDSYKDVIINPSDYELVNNNDTRKVGIGTVNPEAKLHVKGDTKIEGSLNASSFSSVNFNDTEHGNEWRIYNNFYSSYYGLSFLSGTTNRMFLTNSGFLGLGTTSPKERLDLNSGYLRANGLRPYSGNTLNFKNSSGSIFGTLKHANSNFEIASTGTNGINLIPGSGTTTVTGVLNVTGTSSLKNTTITGTLNVTDTSTLTNVIVAGTSNLGDVNIGSAKANKNLTVNGNLSVSNTITTDSLTSNTIAISNGMNVHGASQFFDPLRLSNVYIDGDIYAAGKMEVQEILVKRDVVFPDYVFDDNYNMPSLYEVEDYIEANGHLPGMPSAQHVIENGMDIKAIQLKLVEKVEELTLHMIELKKENEELKRQISGK
ncbi:MAG: hypothetical protein JXR48_17365 [Candidatus Delongbacteria bacterium]|nr:hypothetical protein [Candidatus Delongbacteria bacterium]MBN2836729.1 hypothetical protein [Candidatus Delongbacteria bacterium]